MAWGDEATIADRIQAHYDAGASHVCIQPIDPETRGEPDWRPRGPLPHHLGADEPVSPEPTGINVANVTAWMAERIPDLAGPLDFELITGGASNLTFRVTDTAGGTWVLRRPPTGHVLAPAHDMSREHRIIAALEGTGVPVPPAIGLCQDEDINGADFYVMGFVDGQIVFDFADGQAYPPALRAGLATSLVDTLVDLHALVPADVGLGDLGKTEDYCARQLRRWKRQIDEGSDRDLPFP